MTEADIPSTTLLNFDEIINKIKRSKYWPSDYPRKPRRQVKREENIYVEFRNQWLTKTKDVTKQTVPTQINPGAWRYGAPKINQRKKTPQKAHYGDEKSVGTIQTTSVGTEALEQAITDMTKVQQDLIKRDALRAMTINKLQKELREIKIEKSEEKKARKIREVKINDDIKFVKEQSQDASISVGLARNRQDEQEREIKEIDKKTSHLENTTQRLEMKVEAIEESTNAKLAKFLESVQESNKQQNKLIKEQIATASELNKFWLQQQFESIRGNLPNAITQHSTQSKRSRISTLTESATTPPKPAAKRTPDSYEYDITQALGRFNEDQVSTQLFKETPETQVTGNMSMEEDLDSQQDDDPDKDLIV